LNTVTVQNSNSSNIKKRMITMVGQRMMILMGVMRKKNIKYKERNGWKKDLSAIDMVNIKCILEWEKIMR